MNLVVLSSVKFLLPSITSFKKLGDEKPARFEKFLNEKAGFDFFSCW